MRVRQILQGRMVRQIYGLLFTLRNRHFLVIDLLIFILTPLVAWSLRTDGVGGMDAPLYRESLLIVMAVSLVIKLVVYLAGGLYTYFWRYASLDELGRIGALGLLATALQTLALVFFLQPMQLVASDFPRSIPMIDGILAMLLVGAVRYSLPMVERLVGRQRVQLDGIRVVVAGARSYGIGIVQELQSSSNLRMTPVAFVSDDLEKLNTRIRGVPVLGRVSDLSRVARRTGASMVIIAMPAARGKVIRDIVNVCEQESLQTKIIPGMNELLEGTISVKQLRDVQIEDLLRREPIHTDISAVGDVLRGKRVLVTGAGGSIGSELCRQILRFGPECLILLGHGENSIFEVHSDLKQMIEKGVPLASEQASPQDGIESEAGKVQQAVGANPRLVTVIADIRFSKRLHSIFEELQPQVVFHSAAHKHVPLMEENSVEAITNNVLGTRNVLEAAQMVGIEHFVLISTDKAVNPTSIMGASKRVAELLVRQAALRTRQPYVAVRFGNVLGSRGSVVLTFKQQIAVGGPITVTHPEMVRFFMTIPEAVQLVLQAAPLGRGGEVFMLDMGEPVRIYDLAKDIIELSGLELGRNIDIIFTGLRPGEKLYEELFLAEEHYERTRHEKIFIAPNSDNFVSSSLDERVDRLIWAAQACDPAGVREYIRELVPEFQPNGSYLKAGDTVKEESSLVPFILGN